ncbi:hypothetical protein QQF64_022291 [Cirrhinus molitorella]|uniref:Uncharacterized protein n=1 Tax=Cirrhinus molitorella TaxID=172907 RepID=A0ABR3LBR0_9TELE
MQDYQPEKMFRPNQIKHNTDHHREDLTSFITVTVQSNPALRDTGDQGGFTRPPSVSMCPRGDESQGDVSEPLRRWKEEVEQLMLSHNGPPYTMEPSDISVPAAPLKPEMCQTQSRTHMETLLRRCLFSVYQAR